MAMIDPVEYLQRLQVGLVAGQLPADVSDWLQTGIECYLQGDPLEDSLGLRSRQGERSAPTRISFDRRDEIVRRLARKLEGGTWTMAGLLAEAVADYNHWKQSGINLLDPKNRALLPASIVGWRFNYFEEATRLCLEIPTSQSQLSKILNGRRD
jgi:hypothetical protein